MADNTPSELKKINNFFSKKSNALMAFAILDVITKNMDNRYVLIDVKMENDLLHHLSKDIETLRRHLVNKWDMREYGKVQKKNEVVSYNGSFCSNKSVVSINFGKNEDIKEFLEANNAMEPNANYIVVDSFSGKQLIIKYKNLATDDNTGSVDYDIIKCF